ncbi:MAG: DUF86 domain-containing protein [Planctomycetota bacterium]
MKRAIVDYAADILSCFQETQEFVRGMDFSAFAGDRKTVNAVIHSLEVMGEAAKQIPVEIRERHPGIPWKRMAGMRDKLIHEYSGVDLEIVWGVVTSELPPLGPLFEKLLQELKKG